MPVAQCHKSLLGARNPYPVELGGWKRAYTMLTLCTTTYIPMVWLGAKLFEIQTRIRNHVIPKYWNPELYVTKHVIVTNWSLSHQKMLCLILSLFGISLKLWKPNKIVKTAVKSLKFASYCYFCKPQLLCKNCLPVCIKYDTIICDSPGLHASKK